MSTTEYRAQLDAVVTFSNGGGLRADGFRVDVPGPDVTEQDVASLFIASLNLLMVESVELRNLSVFAEPHKGTRGGPGDRPAPEALRGRIIDLSHPVRDGLITYPGLPAPEIRPHVTRAQSRSRYEPGTEFQIDAITMVGNTGTYLDSPFHRDADGLDLAALPLESCVELPAVLARTAGSGSRAVDVGALAALEVAGRAVLLHTGGDAAWGRVGYAVDAPYLTEAGARWLAARGARLVGIDSVSIDDSRRRGFSRPRLRDHTPAMTFPKAALGGAMSVQNHVRPQVRDERPMAGPGRGLNVEAQGTDAAWPEPGTGWPRRGRGEIDDTADSIAS